MLFLTEEDTSKSNAGVLNTCPTQKAEEAEEVEEEIMNFGKEISQISSKYMDEKASLHDIIMLSYFTGQFGNSHNN